MHTLNSYIYQLYRYKIAAQETVDREGPDMKRYFIQKLCNNGRKPTGNSGTNDTTRRAQEIYQRILCKENVGIYGDDSDIDSPLDFEEEFPEMGNLEGPESNSDDEHNDEIADQPVNNEPVAEPPQKKRRTEKSKNCRNGISARTSVSKAIKTCVDGLQGSNNTNVLLSCMQMMQQQNQQMMQQQNQQMMQMMMFIMGNRGSSQNTTLGTPLQISTTRSTPQSSNSSDSCGSDPLNSFQNPSVVL